MFLLLDIKSTLSVIKRQDTCALERKGGGGSSKLWDNLLLYDNFFLGRYLGPMLEFSKYSKKCSISQHCLVMITMRNIQISAKQNNCWQRRDWHSEKQAACEFELKKFEIQTRTLLWRVAKNNKSWELNN